MRIGGSRTKKAADQGRHVQAVVDRIDKRGGRRSRKTQCKPVSASIRRRFAAQHLKKSGSRVILQFSPMYEAPA